MGAAESKQEDVYDIVIDIDNIKTATRGWPIDVSPEIAYRLKPLFNSEDMKDPIELLKQALFKLNIQRSTIVSVSGLFNKGKTFLLNKLAQVELPSDVKVSTKGLSFKLPKTVHGANWLLLDTAGTNSPVHAIDENALAYKKATELFLQDLVFELSDVMIVVVNELTWAEQEFLQALHNRLQHSQKPYKHLYVVHNFLNISEEAQLKHMWKSRAVNCFPGHLVKKVVTVNSKEEQHTYIWQTASMDLYHLFLAKEGSNAGNVWNPRTYALLRTLLADKMVGQQEPFVERLLRLTSQFLRQYCKDVSKANVRVNADMLLWRQGKEDKEKEREPEKEKQQKAITQVVRKPAEEKGTKGSAVLSLATNYQLFERDSEEDSWSSLVDIEELPSRSPIQLCVEGDLSLTREKVSYDGYHITLSGQLEFDPPCDMLRFDEEKGEGLYILVDLPGFRAADSNGVSATVEKSNSKDSAVQYVNLILKGERKLTMRKVVEGVTDRDAMPYSPEDIEQMKGRPRRSVGKFECCIPIPAQYERKISKMTLKDGVLQVFLLKDKTPEPIRPTED